ncbi:MAG: zinc metalloprotease HtpX [Candidatus Woesearchaeota archaeon]
MVSKNHIKTALLLGTLTGLLLLVGRLIGGITGLTVALLFSAFMNLGALFVSDKLVLAMYRAEKAKGAEFKELHQIVEEVARKAGIPKPKIYIIPSNAANAFATGRSPRHSVVAVTRGILSILNKEELKGVIAHEISHIKNHDMLVATIAATIAGVISYIAQVARFAAIFGERRDERRSSGIIGLIFLAIFAPLIALLLQLAISRSREYLADESGARTIENPKALASALAKLEQSAKHRPLTFGNETTASLFIVNPFSAKSFAALFSTHPPIAARIERLMQMKI